MALRVGLTGGIASGKSTVATRFETLGAAVIDADQVSRALMQAGSPLLAQVLERFGPAVAQRYGRPLTRFDGNLDRSLLRRLIFEDAGERRALEALLHPAIRARMDELAAQAQSPYQLHVVPLLVENHARSRYDRVLVIDCPVELQLARLMARDGMDAQQAQAMLAAQAPRAEHLAAADDIIMNDADPAALDPQVRALDRKYRALAHAKDAALHP